MDNKPNFQLPNTKMCVVKYADIKDCYKDGNPKLKEVLIDTPSNNPSLIHTMLMKYRIGYSQLRAVKGVGAENLITAGRFNTVFA